VQQDLVRRLQPLQRLQIQPAPPSVRINARVSPTEQHNQGEGRVCTIMARIERSNSSPARIESAYTAMKIRRPPEPVPRPPANQHEELVNQESDQQDVQNGRQAALPQAAERQKMTASSSFTLPASDLIFYLNLFGRQLHFRIVPLSQNQDSRLAGVWLPSQLPVSC